MLKVSQIFTLFTREIQYFHVKYLLGQPDATFFIFHKWKGHVIVF